MIKPQDRFFSEGQGYFGPNDNPITEAHCNVWDWDQLRLTKVKGTAKLFARDEDVESQILSQFANYLSLEVRAVTMDDDGLLTGMLIDPNEDDTTFLAYLPFSITSSLSNCRVIRYSKLQELDRLGPGVDLSLYEANQEILKRSVLNFNPIPKGRRLQMAWDEVNLLKSLPPRPNIVPFDCVVLENVESRVIGFTTKYMPGGTLETQLCPFDLSGSNS